MGQAKQRGTYDERLKQAQSEGRTKFKRKSKLMMASYHYKSNTDDGVLFTLLPQLDPALRERFYTAVTDCVAKMTQDIDHGHWHKWVDIGAAFNSPIVRCKETALDWYMAQLLYYIPKFNQLVWGQPTHPKGEAKMHHDWKDQDFLESAVIIATAISLLTHYGRIPQDNFNGTQYMYSLDNTVTVGNTAT